eukprot:TRINITY_DN6587_c0_g1_i2.p1 TRINITY_DN6587_c0_g1~~TRINITY_DN6587_c0_g1_i2.p1  ORF type:complete len:450 (+),score=70.61 TRINITY_DN6587_c0_g1_i2:87-1436(+)
MISYEGIMPIDIPEWVVTNCCMRSTLVEIQVEELKDKDGGAPNMSIHLSVPVLPPFNSQLVNILHDDDEEIVSQGDGRHLFGSLRSRDDEDDLEDDEDPEDRIPTPEMPQLGQLLHSPDPQKMILGSLPGPNHGIPMLPPFPLPLLPRGPYLPPGLPLIATHHPGPVVVPTLPEVESPPSPEDNGKPRKTRWRPSQEQRTILESVWTTNPYPDQATKQQIVKQFGGQSVTYKQITSWFKHKRENDKNRGKFEYRYSPAAKFTPEQVVVLESVFLSEAYAKGKTLQDLSVQLGVSVKRIQNWFKHKRSRLAQQGKFEYKPRFDEVANMTNLGADAFQKALGYPGQSPILDIISYEPHPSDFNIKPSQVTRWFANEKSRKRKEQRCLPSFIDHEEDLAVTGEPFLSPFHRPLMNMGPMSPKRMKSRAFHPHDLLDVPTPFPLPDINDVLEH